MEQIPNIPRLGMQFTNPSLIKKGTYRILVNGNIQNYSGDFALISNDPSNILATKFKEGYKVIGTLIAPSLSVTFFFLTNPSTQQSEIGFIYDTSSPDKPDAVSSDGKIIESLPLETINQLPVSNYHTFVNADCLNFDIDHPVSSWVKIDDCNVRIYFNDFKNPPRFIDYTNFPKINISNCPLIETDQLDCDKIKIFPTSCYPQLEVIDVIPGGNNEAGVYQFALCYSDVNSNKITDYFYVTNPIPLYSEPITIPTNYPVAKSFKILISNINIDFKYLNLAVVKTINNVSTPYLIETFDVTSDKFEYVFTGANIQQNLALDDILGKLPYYNKAKITAESEGYSFLANLEEDRILNLQPVVSEIPLKWMSVELNDGDYANPIIAQNYVSYLGDEVYPFGIALTKTNGKQTNVFPFVNRQSTPYDIEDVSCLTCNSLNEKYQLDCASGLPSSSGLCINPDVISYSSCSGGTKPSLRWQVYNTASVDEDDPLCTDFIETGEEQQLTDEVVCYSNELLVDLSNPEIPKFYAYPPPSDIVYPPTNSAETQAFKDWLDSQTPIQVNIDDIGLCDCNSYLSQYPEGATALPITIDTNFNSSDCDVELLTDNYTGTINTYTSTGNVASASNYPFKPTPCRKYADADKQSEEGYEGWINAKENWTSNSPTLLSQSSSSNCGVETWGAFINDPPSLTESWYTFYCTNADGVASVLLSTSNPYYELSVYGANQNGTVNLGDIKSTGFYSNEKYLLLNNLTQGDLYYVKVAGTYPLPTLSTGYVLPNKCKEAVFKLCVVTPNPETAEEINIPGIAKIGRRCEITYYGFPTNDCAAKPYKKGEFAYWESTETYPCNEEVWGDLAGKPIRHFKFPDQTVTPFFEEVGAVINSLSVKKNKIYPKGILIDINDIKLAIDKAVANGLITNEERNQICGYRIYRGNRRGNESIIAKGLLYDVWQYKDNIYNTENNILFPNFPFNDNSPNDFIKNKRIKRKSQLNDSDYLVHPYENGAYNNKYTFDAPNLSFNNPSLGTELKLECEQYGKSVGSFIELKNNTKYQYIGAGVISAAIGFSSIEASFEALNTLVNATLTIPITVVGSGTSLPLGLILAAVGENIIAPIRIYSHYAEWYDIIKKFAPFRNYGTYYTGVGKYTANYPVEIGNVRRNIANTQYLKPGILNVSTLQGSIRFNNFQRDSSVFVELDRNSIFLATTKEDNSRQLPDCNNFTGLVNDISSYYGSMKVSNLNQYGQIDNIEWIDTGYNGKIEWDNSSQDTSCSPIFGGDTYINRFTKKRKTPMFLEDRVINSSINTGTLNQDIQLSLLPNIGYPRFFMDYPTAYDYTGITNALFGDVAIQSNLKVDYNFLCAGSDGKAWQQTGLAAAILGSFAGASFGIISLPITVGIIVGKTRTDLGDTVYITGKYIHSFYGVTSFLVESNYNLDLRHGENIKEKDFYPNVGDINEWTQQYFVPISEDNYYIYNNDYSKQNTLNPNFVLNNDFSQVKADCKVSQPNLLIYSLKDNDQNDEYDGNRVFLANNKYLFPKSAGRLLIVRGLSNGKVLCIQENGYSVFNSYISQETNIGISTVGSNSLFNQSIPAQSIKTDLGLGGSQTPAIAVTEFGAYWVDNKRGQIFQFQNSAENIIKAEEEWWFKENLPFHILEDFPEFDITNNFKYIGMTITYDARFKKILFTKRDVELKPEYKGFVTYDGTLFHYNGETFTTESTKYFCNKSFTIAYSPLLKSFTSFYTFYPNYYIPNQAYFSSGINYPITNEQQGLFHHNLTSKSYNVYYGNLNPFLFEYTVPSNLTNNMLESIQYISEYQRYRDNLSFGLVPDKTYNKAVIYNQRQSSGLLELVVKEKNNRQQSYQYASGKQNQNSRSILVEKVNNVWSFNNFYNVAPYNTGQPLMSYQCNNIAFTEINPSSINYKPQFLKEKLVSDYQVIRLINDKYSNYLINHRYNITQINKYNQ